jgi:CRISPR/Cas system-associated exonuclease Cas4 (RecB family)
MAKNIENGVLLSVSPSMLTAFDPKSPFGCARRGWFKYVAGMEEPQTGGQNLGEMLHALIERRLEEGRIIDSVESEAAGLYIAGQSMIEEVAARKILSVESKLPPFQLDGVNVKGYVDVVTEDGIIDWKTTSDIKRYGKTAAQLATDTQMVIYALACHPTRETVKLAHGQFQTKGTKHTRFEEIEVTGEHLAKHRDAVIIPAIKELKEIAKKTKHTEVEPNFKSCFNCAFRAHCPKEGSESVMSFFSKLNAPAVAPVAPPDAPKSDPVLAAEKPKLKIEDAPVPAVLTATQIAIMEENNVSVAADKAETKKRGRPPGAKNKIVVGGARGPEVLTYDPKDACVPLAPKPVANVKSVTVTKGFTINLGSYSSVRFEVSMVGEGSDHVDLYDFLYNEVQDRLAAEAKKFDAEVDAKTKLTRPGNEVIK